ncbi:MAG: TlyA family RNA methyltransferase [Actinomycetota bacterium]|nr:TlyA family RNA methyltransferase [Actinomycetota bacterium]
MAKQLRLDAELVRRGLVGSRAEARRAIEAGLVVVRGLPATRVATMVSPADALALKAPPRRFVSRGGDKLDGALDRLTVEVAGRRWLDAGASTGGFTDRLLQGGAAAVIALDVGYGQLAWILRGDDRVTVLERTNIRTVDPGRLPWRPDGVVADLSFISLTLVLPALAALAAERSDFVVMVKPQFEVGKENIGKGGVVSDPALWLESVQSVVAKAAVCGLAFVGATASDVPGPAGNREFFVHLHRAGPHNREARVQETSAEHAIARAIGEAVRD